MTPFSVDDFQDGRYSFTSVGFILSLTRTLFYKNHVFTLTCPIKHGKWNGLIVLFQSFPQSKGNQHIQRPSFIPTNKENHLNPDDLQVLVGYCEWWLGVYVLPSFLPSKEHSFLLYWFGVDYGTCLDYWKIGGPYAESMCILVCFGIVVLLSFPWEHDVGSNWFKEDMIGRPESTL